MSTITETTTLKPSPAAIAIIVFGRDEAGKAHASWSIRPRLRWLKRPLT
jgi:hypothetical protein